MDNFEYDNINDDNSMKNNSTGVDAQRPMSFYTENFSKPVKKKNNILVQLIAVAVISSILSGSVVASFFLFIGPAVQPSLKDYLGNFIPALKTQGTSLSNLYNTPYEKIVKIEQTDSIVSAIAEKVSPSIVGVRSIYRSSDFFFGQQEFNPEGSGIIIKDDGYILTNNHVIERSLVQGTNKLADGARIEVVLPDEKNTTYTARVVGRDSRTDIAVLKIEAKNLPAAELGDSDQLKPGEIAVAIGNPGGMEYMGSITAGVISGLNRKIQTDNGRTLNLIQTDAAINPGNSGGALVNSKGEVIGVNTIKVVAQGFEGLGFAIPINEAREISDNLIEHKYVRGRPLLGIEVDLRFTKAIAERNSVPMGIYIKDVSPFTGAYDAGIKTGDIITRFDGADLEKASDPMDAYNKLEEAKNKRKPGDVIDVEIFRKGERQIVKVTLSEAKGEY